MTAPLAPCVCGPNGNCPVDCPNRPATKRKRGNPEGLIQRAIIDRLRFAGVLCVAVPNEGARSMREGRRLKSNGLRPGFPDLIAIQRGRVAFMEVKAATGRLSPAQSEMHAELERQGVAVGVVRSQDDAVLFLRSLGFTA